MMSDRNLSVVPDGGGGRSPAVAADLLGRHLRRLREAAGLLQKDVVAAKAIGSESMLSKIETGKVPVQERHVRRLVQLYTQGDPGDLEACLAMAREASQKEWFAAYHDVIPDHGNRLFSQERDAQEIRTFEAQHVPGLLQIPDYAQAIMMEAVSNAQGFLQADDLAALRRRIAFRLERQMHLSLPGAPDFFAVLDENVLRRTKCSAPVMRAQLRHLYNVAENSARTNIRVLPFDADVDLAPAHSSVMLLSMRPGYGDDLVYIESSNVGGVYVSDPAEVEKHRQRLTTLFMGAAGKDATLEIIDRNIQRLVGKR
ncbi:helix-turn-helix domain-containing protein [Streptomyces bauhiniae]|uniref:helix-turn-helix domain-containing protein n=1 Tax=Streptomyces bauhiniae TaxID=2340725 RepID=UPI0035DC5850